MVGVGYLAKKIVPCPDWLQAPGVEDIYSVSNCVSPHFMDYTKFWRHNGYWLFDSPQIIQELAQENSIDLEGFTFFYYEVYEKQYDEQRKQWLTFQPEAFRTDVISPAKKELQGYDVVSFSMGTTPECSPLSCNRLAREIPTNAHCLLKSFEEAEESLESGKFIRCEPGPFRIFMVYTIDVKR